MTRTTALPGDLTSGGTISPVGGKGRANQWSLKWISTSASLWISCRPGTPQLQAFSLVILSTLWNPPGERCNSGVENVPFSGKSHDKRLSVYPLVQDPQRPLKPADANLSGRAHSLDTPLCGLQVMPGTPIAQCKSGANHCCAVLTREG